MATVLAALIGAFFGSMGAVALQEWLRARRERREHREALVNRYLFQLQDAVEALWHRVYNVRHEGGRGAMTPAYQASTTVYALGRVLAAERILTLEGVYPQLRDHYPELGETLQARRLSVELRFADFQQYDRIALAEAVLEQDEHGFRPSTYLAFQARYLEGTAGEASWLERARIAVGGLGDDPTRMDAWLDLLGTIAQLTSAATGIPTSIAEKARTLARQVAAGRGTVTS
jgi:hypothetical protein